MRTLWHLPLMLSGDLGWVLGTVARRLQHGDAPALAGQRRSVDTRGGLARVAQRHRRPVLLPDGDRRRHDRIVHLLAVAYALLAVAAYLAWGRPRRRATTRARRERAPSGAALEGAVPRRTTAGGTDDSISQGGRHEARHQAARLQLGGPGGHALAASPRTAGGSARHRRGHCPCLRPCGHWGSNRSRPSRAGSRSPSSRPSSTSTRSASCTAGSSRRCWTPRWAAPSTRCCQRPSVTSPAS